MIDSVKKYKAKIKVILFWLMILLLTAFFVKPDIFTIKYTVLLMLIYCGICAYLKKKLLFSIYEVALILFLGIYSLLEYSLYDALCFISIVLGTYYFVKYIVYNYRDKESKIVIVLYALVIGYMMFALLNLKGFYDNPERGMLRREWPELFSGSILTTTSYAIYYSVILSQILPAFLLLKRYKIPAFFVILLSVLSLGYSTYFQSRIPIMIMLITYIIETIAFFICCKDNTKTKKILIWSYIVLFFSVFIFSIVVLLNINNIQSNSLILKLLEVLKRDGGIFGNIRFKIQWNVISQLLQNPLGGHKANLLSFPHCHNVWLDIANDYGIPLFALFSVYTVFTLLNVVKLLKKDCISVEHKLMLVGAYFSFFLYYSVESPWYSTSYVTLVGWVYVQGIISGCVSKGENG